MRSTKTKTLAFAGSALMTAALMTGCGGNSQTAGATIPSSKVATATPTVAPVTVATPATTPPASPSASPTASQDRAMTMDEAGKYYLKIAGEYNAAVDKLPLSSLDENASLSEVQDYCDGAAKAQRAFLGGMLAKKWPAKVEQQATDLTKATAVATTKLRACADAPDNDGVNAALEDDFNANAAAEAQLLRAALRLPDAPSNLGQSAKPEKKKASSTGTVKVSSGDTIKFGGTADFGTGLTVKISKPTTFTPSADAREIGDFPASDTGVAFKVTITNKSSKAYDPNNFSSTASSGDTEAEEIFDSAHGFEGAPMTKVLSGRSVSFKIGYAVKDSKDVVLEVSADWSGDSALFVS